MQDITIEDTILLIDISRSMLKRDFKPSRLNLAIQTAKNFIKNKLTIDSKDRIAVISFGDVTKKLIHYSYDENSLINSLKKVQISGKGYLYQAIAFSLQMIAQEMRKIGGKIQRIFVISDNSLKNDYNKLMKLTRIAKGLGVYIDACQIGKKGSNDQNILKTIAQITNGDFGYFNNSKAVLNAGKSFASKKMVRQTEDYFYNREKKITPPLISEIALSLKRPSVMEIRSMMRYEGKEQEKCAICHSIKAPLTGADFYSEGRYCPNCDKAMHLSCAAMWARKSEHKENIFRCPFCYFLLILPKFATKLIKNEGKDSQKIKIIEEIAVKETKMIEIPDNMIEQIDVSCSYCYNIFSKDFKVFKCEKCEAYYHESCLQKMYDEMKACRYCGARITFNS